MIGVVATAAERGIVCEFFELFKTAWEFARRGVNYDVLICSRAEVPKTSSAELTIVYGKEPSPTGLEQGIQTCSRSNRILRNKEDRIPIYCDCLSFKIAGHDFLVDEMTREPVAFQIQAQGQRFIRIGFDLFSEIRYLLTQGQPALHARIPTLELHIAFLRNLILRSSISLLEVPPIPDGFNFIACLTHDVDHPIIRAHRWDRTIGGFLYRALIRSIIDFCRGRTTIRDLVSNWLAAFSLPFVYLGLARDFWSQFERYSEIERGSPSTFFVIPKADDPGQTEKGLAAPAKRAARYSVSDIADQLKRLQSTHHEIGLHGIDAWRDVDGAQGERAAVQSAISPNGDGSVNGVRMHWLYYSDHSPAILEQAGFTYDSSVGYNDTIGYRAGTCQVFRPLGVQRLRELPLHVMDTALLFPSYMNLSPAEAKNSVDELISNARRFGGVLTINWHDRSIAPERLWQQPYSQIVAELKRNGAWFATGSEVVAWFDKRRAAAFDLGAGAILVRESTDHLPALRIKEHVLLQPVGVTAEPTKLSYCSAEL